MGNWLCDKHNTYMDERSTPCIYCEVDRLRSENATLRAALEHEKFLKQLVRLSGLMPPRF